tara:strand:+ start:5514 stop:6164 length:651 start_codon:yes stop_codon:yes gene_type:complete
MKFFLLLAATCCTVSAQTNNILDTFVSTFTFASQDEARALVDIFEKCDNTALDESLFQQVLRTGINATRSCTSEISREHAKKCIDRFGTLATLSTSPYNALSMEKLSASDISSLEACGTDLPDGQTTSGQDAILNAFLLIVKRFGQCGLTTGDLTQKQKDAILDVFKGTEQNREVNRALLSNLCSSLHFGGAVHQDIVNFLTASFKTYVVLLPNRR